MNESSNTNNILAHTKVIKEYIANQLKADRQADQLSIFAPNDPLTGSK